jgi:DNA/RNA endonuclease YhcR with UshA esterase domain
MLFLAVLFAAVLPAGPPAMEHGDSIRKIPAAEAAGFVGQRVTVEGIVAGVRKTSQGDVWLDLEEKSPRQALSVVVVGATARRIGRLTEYVGKRINATGVVDRTKGVLRVLIDDPSQLGIAAEPNRVPCDE